MQYAGHAGHAGQTSRFLKTRLTEHYRRIKSLAKLIFFLYRHFKFTNHSP